jgi:hypothetical protein
MIHHSSRWKKEKHTSFMIIEIDEEKNDKIQ